MPRHLELLAPGGDIDAIKAAIVAGADAIYCGLDRFNARGRAANITLDALGGVLALAHQHDCKVFLTLNIVLVESDIAPMIGLLNTLVNTSIDGVIVQDLGLLHLLRAHFPSIEVHASTQLTTHNEGQVAFLAQLGVRRVNLARELELNDIRDLCTAARRWDLSTEVFVHGSYCLGFSGICTLSSIHGLDSGNRGRCSQPCRARYETTPAGVNHPLNMVDNSAYGDAAALLEAGVNALKIEGRIKKFPYVYTVTRAWRQQIHRLYQQVPLPADSPALQAAFNRGFSNGYLRGDVGRDMFVDNPRNQAAQQIRDRPTHSDEGTNSRSIEDAYDEIAALAETARHAIAGVSTDKATVNIRVSGEADGPLRVSVDRPTGAFTLESEIPLVPRRQASTTPPLDAELQRRFAALEGSEHRVGSIESEALAPGLFLPFAQIRRLEARILYALNGSREPIASIDPKGLEVPERAPIPTPSTLSVLVSSEEDLELCQGTNAALHFQLPSSMGERLSIFVDLISHNPSLTPWFPAVLIGDDYAAAVELLRLAQPTQLVTNNTGIAWAASQAGIRWIAGSELNITNAHSLQCLKHSFGCAGAFVSNELSHFQIRRIRPPQDFELYYSIHHPMRLLTSRQCLFHQVTGCHKARMDSACLPSCERSAALTNLQGDRIVVHKTRGNHPSLFLDKRFLNTRIVTDMPGLFNGFLIDLTDVGTQSPAKADKATLIPLFEGLLRGDPGAAGEIKERTDPTTCELYRRGI